MNKKILLISALSVLALTGCQKSDTGSDQPSSSLLSSSKAIDFDTYAARAVTKSGTPQIDQFSVEAFLTGSSTLYFPATTYRYQGSRYVGDTTRFWPADEYQHLDFYAVSPLKYYDYYAGESDLEPTAELAIRVTRTNGETDIVAARCGDASYEEGHPVVLTFQHKLTKVSFTAIGSDITKKYVIKGLTLRANSTAYYTFATDGWNIPEGGGDLFNYCYVDVSSSVTIPINSENPSFLGTKYLIPNQGDFVSAYIYYKVYEGETLICDHTTDGVELNLPATAWGVNKNVVYALTIGLSGARPIEFTTTLDEWVLPSSEIPVQ